MAAFSDKIVFVTGATSGIGRATALAFAREGARLLLCARRLEELSQLTPALTEAGAPDVLNLRLDVRDREAVEKTLADLPEEWRPIAVLVNNAGLSRGLEKLFLDDIDNWDEMIDTNVKGLLYVTRAVVPGMVERKSGHVINLGSTAGHMTYAGGSVYCASKAAERAITEGLRIDAIGTGIRVTTVDPGMVETNFSEIRFRGDKDRAAKVYQGLTPLKADDIAETIVWAATRPAHVQIQTIVITPTDQANAVTLNKKQ